MGIHQNAESGLNFDLDGYSQFSSKKIMWIITYLGVAGYIFSLIFLIYGTLLLIAEFYRVNFTSLIFASYLSAIMVFFLSKAFINKFGAETIHIHKDLIILERKFGNTKTIPNIDILYIKVKEVNPIIELLPLSKPVIILITYNKVYRIQSLKYQNGIELLDHFRDQNIVTNDDFAIYYHRSKNYISEILFRFSQDTPGILSLLLIIIFTFLALWGGFAMLIAPPEPRYINVLFLRNPEFQNYDLPGYNIETAILAPPSSDFWFGTDFIGRDLFARLIFGTTFTFIIALSGATLSIILILFFGLTSAIFPGRIDNVIMRVSDSLLSFPPYVFLIVFSTISVPLRLAMPGGFFLAVYMGMAFVTWPAGARLIRSEVRILLNSEFIEASKQLGASNTFILIKHIIPQILPTILIVLTYQITDIILGTTLLGFIGFASESTLTWGSDLSHALFNYGGLIYNWWTVFFPSLFIFLLVLGLTLFSDSMKDNLDTTLRGGIKALPYEIRKEMNI